MKLSRSLEPIEQDRLAKELKRLLGISLGAFRKSLKSSDQEAPNDEVETPKMYFDGDRYFRPRAGSYDKIVRADAFLELRHCGFSAEPPEGGGLAPVERAIHNIQTNNRVHFAGSICGRPVGAHKEGDIMILATSGPVMIEGAEGDCAPMENFVSDLLGRGQDEFAQTQLITFCGWLKHFRAAIRNHQQHLPGQALALVGPKDCGKSLLQFLITLMTGGRGCDASLYLLGKSDFNKELWGAEHLIIDDDVLGDDGREAHAVRDRLKKLTVAHQFNVFSGEGRNPPTLVGDFNRME